MGHILQSAISVIKRSKGYIREIATVAEAKADKHLSSGQKIRITERTSGLFDVVSIVTNPANNADIIASDALPTLSIKASHKGVDLLAADFGIMGGIVDINAFKRAITVSNETSKDIQFFDESYDFNNQDVSNGGGERGQDIGSYRVKGIKGRTNFNNIGTLHCSGFVRSIDVNYNNCIQPVYMTGNIADMDIYGNQFIGCRRSIYHNDSGAGAKISRGHIHHNICSSHIEDDFVGFVLLQRAPYVDDVLIEHNTIKDIQSDADGYSIFSGILIGNDNHPVSNFNRNKANNNTILNCGQATLTYKNPSFGIVIIGRDSEQINNTARDGKWLEPFYMKGNSNKQNFNKVHDCQHSGVSMKLMLDTNASKLNEQIGSIVTGQCDRRPAVRMFGSGLSLNSQVDIYSTEQVEAQGGLAYQATRSTTTDGLLKITGNFKASKGIEINTAGDVEIDVRLVSDGAGITVIKSVDESLGYVKVKGSIECNEQALNVNWCEDFIIDGSLKVKCNRANDNVFIYTQNTTNLNGLSLHVTDKLSDGASVGSPIKLYAKDGNPLGTHLTKVDDFHFVSERSFTQLIQYNADPILVSQDTSKLSISDAEIDLSVQSGSYLIRSTSDISKVSLRGVEVDGLLAQTINANGKNIGTLLVNQCLLENAATPTAAAHTGATVGKSIITTSKAA